MHSQSFTLCMGINDDLSIKGLETGQDQISEPAHSALPLVIKSDWKHLGIDCTPLVCAVSLFLVIWSLCQNVMTPVFAGNFSKGA